MSFRNNSWDIPIPDWENQNRLVSELSISPITAQVLINRGISSKEEAHDFLYGTLNELSSPWLLPGMIPAVNRIVKAIAEGEKVLIYGDYDVDGMTATALLTLFLKSLGINPGYYIPDRNEGYGLNKGALDFIKEQDYSLIITVDCGISAIEEVAYGKSLGLDFVITDHHEPGEKLPDVEAIINPKLINEEKHFSELAGVGVAFKLAQGLAEKLQIESSQLETHLDLVALGTIADIVPLVKENRILVKCGLEKLKNTHRVGLKALLEIARLEGRDLGTFQVAFMLAPRLNAAGRMGCPLIGLELLLTDSPQQGREKALRLQELNNSRQLLEQSAQKEALELIKKEGEEITEKILVLASPLWHSGILGIVASRLAENFARPVILLTIEGEQAKGSGRSVPGFDLFEALKYCDQLLLKSGGHSQAVGLTLETAKLDEFKKMLNEYADQNLNQELMCSCLDLEGLVLLEQLDFQLVEELALLEPFGHGNPKPVFAAQGAFLKNYRYVGKNNNHLKCTISWEQGDLDGIGFNMAELAEHSWAFEEPIDLAFSVEKNDWNGQTKLQLVLEDFKNYSSLTTKNNMGVESLQTEIEISEKFFDNRHFHFEQAGEQIQLSLKIILNNLSQAKSVLLTFPSQRVLAIYEGFLGRNLAELGVRHKRLSGKEISQIRTNNFQTKCVYLAKEDSLLEDILPNLNTIKYLFPKFADEEKGAERAEHTSLGFKNLLYNHYQFIMEPIIASKKIDYLKEILNANKKPLIIYTNRKSFVIHLYNELRKTFPESRHRIWCYHQSLSYEQKEMVVQATAVGLADIVVASELFELDLHEWPGAATKILVDAPYNLEELFLKSRPQKERVEVYGIWSQEDLQLNEEILKTIYPEQEHLEVIFDFLNRESAYKVGDVRKIVSLLQKQFPRIQNVTLQYILDIITEQQKAKNNTTINFYETHSFRLAEAEKRGIQKLVNTLGNENIDLTSYILAGTN